MYDKDVKYIILSILCGLTLFALPFSAILHDAGVLQVPLIFFNSYEEHDIYLSLFEVQAASIGIMLAVIALLIGIIKEKRYGLSVSKYIMHHKPPYPLRYKLVVIELILAIVVSGFAIQYKWYSIVTALFYVSLFLLLYISTQTVKIIHSQDSLSSEIGKFIKQQDSTEFLNNLTSEISNCITCSDVVNFGQNVEFFKELFSYKVNTDITPKNVKIFEDSISQIMEYAHDSQSEKFCFDTLILISDIYEIANRGSDKNVITSPKTNHIRLNLIDDRVFFQLFKYANLTKIKEKHLISRMLSLIFSNTVFPTNYDASQVNNYHVDVIASWIYLSIKENASENKLKEQIYTELLSSSLLSLPESPSDYSNTSIKPVEKGFFKRGAINIDELIENNCINFLVALFHHQEYKILRNIYVLKDEKEPVRHLPKLFVEYGKVKNTKISVYSILYVYYLAHREDKKLLLNESEQVFLNELLEENTGNVGKLFYEFLFNRKALYDAFIFAYLHEHERMHPGPFVDSKSPCIFDTVVEDFFVFTSTHLSIDESQLKGDIEFYFPNESNVRSALDRYVSKDTFELYQTFCHKVLGVNPDASLEKHRSISDKYNIRLKNAITLLLREKQVTNAAINAEKFETCKENFEKSMLKTFEAVIKEFFNEFGKLEKQEKMNSPKTIRSKWCIPIDVCTGESSLGDEFIFETIKNKLTSEIFDKIEDKLIIKKTATEDERIKKMLEAVPSDTNAILSDVVYGYYVANGSEEDALSDKLIEKKKNHIELGGSLPDKAIFINTNKIKVKFDNLSVCVTDLSDTGISKEIGDDNTVEIEGTSTRFATKEEAEKYIKNSLKIVEYALDLVISKPDDIVGGGIDIKDEK